MSDNHIPSRNNSNAVRRFANIIATINANYPKAVLLSNNLYYSNVSEFRNMMRGAIRGIVKYGVEHPTIPREQIMQWAESYTTKIFDGNVVVGDSEAVKAYKLAPTKTIGLALDATIVVDNTEALEPSDEPVLRAMLLLLSKGYVENLSLPATLRKACESLIEQENFDLSILEKDSKIYIY